MIRGGMYICTPGIIRMVAIVSLHDCILAMNLKCLKIKVIVKTMMI